MKRIVFVIESLHLGGAEKSLVTLLHCLDYTKYQVALLLFNQGGIFLNQVPPRVRIIYSQVPKLSFVDRFYHFVLRKYKGTKFHKAQLFWSVIKNKRFDEVEKYDMAIAYNQGFATYFVATYIMAKTKYAWLNIDYKQAGYNINFDYDFYTKYNKVIAVSQQAKNSLKTELQKINQKLPIQIIKDIIDKDQLMVLANAEQEIKFKADTINIVTVARWAKQKGLDLAIASCKKLIDKGYKVNWYAVGEGPEHKYLERLIEQNNLKEVFFLIEATNNPYPYMKNCDIYVQTSLFEGLGLTVIEASYLNKPIVSTNFNTIYSIIEDEKTGLVADMNPKSIAAKIERLITDKALRGTFSNNLAKYKNNDKEETLKKLSELFNV